MLSSKLLIGDGGRRQTSQRSPLFHLPWLIINSMVVGINTVVSNSGGMAHGVLPIYPTGVAVPARIYDVGIGEGWESEFANNYRGSKKYIQI